LVKFLIFIKLNFDEFLSTIYATDEIPSFALRKNASILLMKKSKLFVWFFTYKKNPQVFPRVKI